jgi:hypothetical protein
MSSYVTASARGIAAIQDRSCARDRPPGIDNIALVALPNLLRAETIFALIITMNLRIVDVAILFG